MVSSRAFFLFLVIGSLGCLTGNAPSHAPSPPLSSSISTNTGPPPVPDIVDTDDGLSSDDSDGSDILQVIPDNSGPFDIAGRNWDYGTE